MVRNSFKIKPSDKIYYKKCNLCGKENISLSEQQCNFNHKVHYESCRIKQIKEESKNEKHKRDDKKLAKKK